MTIGLVTGAGAGIGRATALRLAEKGHDLGLVDIDPEAVGETAEMLRSLGRNALAIQADVTQEEEVRAFVDQVERELGPIEAFLANAGIIGAKGPIWEYDAKVLHQVWQVNTCGVFLGLKYVGERMVQRKRGAIVVMGSTSSVRGRPNSAGYVSSKHAALGLTRVAALDMMPFNVRVNAVAPGPLETQLIRSLLERREKSGTEGLPKSARKIGQPEDVASVVTFLLSEEAAHVNGAVWVIDGGNTID